jgi:IS5 family transposase
LAKTGKDEAIWDELQRQLDVKGPEVRKGTIRDATFITADPGHAMTLPRAMRIRPGEVRTLLGRRRVRNPISDSNSTPRKIATSA